MAYLIRECVIYSIEARGLGMLSLRRRQEGPRFRVWLCQWLVRRGQIVGFYVQDVKVLRAA